LMTFHFHKDSASLQERRPNEIGRANRRPSSSFIVGRQFESSRCAPRSLSAAVANLWR